MNNTTRNELGLPSIEQSMSQRNRRRTDHTHFKSLVVVLSFVVIVELAVIIALIKHLPN